MSFKILATGSENFHFSEREVVEQSDFELIGVINDMRKIKPVQDELVKAAVEKILPSAPAPPSALEAVGVLGTTVYACLLSEVMDMLAARGTSDKSVSVSAREASVLWADSVGFRKYGFAPGIEPGIEFMRAIAPILEKTNLSDWSVLMMLSIILSQYDDHLAKVGGTPNILIQINK
jgi:hypothetical protein